MTPKLLVRLLTAALVAGLVIVSAGPASAHTEITGSDPADGATLQKAPQRVTVTFSQAPLATGLAVVAQGPDDSRQELPAQVRGNSVVAAWPPDASGGDYVVTYRVVAADGHPITGQVKFRIAAPRPAASASATGAPTPSPVSSVAAAPGTDQGGGQGSAVPYWLWAVGAILLVAASYVIVSRGRSSGGADS